jgi:predicted Rossmann fold flavoprotein
MSIQYDVIIIGAGAAGMMSAIEAGKRGRKVLLVDHYKKIGEKIRISGGGRCNFTNINTNPSKFLSQNPKFVRSALSQYTQNDFINLINKYEIKFHEKKLGQLFCDHSAQQIVEMLLKRVLFRSIQKLAPLHLDMKSLRNLIIILLKLYLH